MNGFYGDIGETHQILTDQKLGWVRSHTTATPPPQHIHYIGGNILISIVFSYSKQNKTSVMDWRSIQGVFLPHAQCSWGQLWILHNPDEDKAVMY